MQIVVCIFTSRMIPTDLKEQRVLISVLNWGMGHVSRSIGLIHQLIAQNNTIIIACDVSQQEIFKQYFNDIEYIEHKSYPFKFSGGGNFGWDLIRRFSPLYKCVNAEFTSVENYVREYNIDVVLSDHRYGFRSTKVPSIFMTHQVNLPLKWYTVLAGLMHKKWLKQFDFIWVFDVEDNRLAGKLSAIGRLKNAHYIGWYSRFSTYLDEYENIYPYALVVSGPLVYGQQLMDEVTKDWDMNKELIVVCDDSINVPTAFRKISGDWKQQDQILLQTQHVFSRSGYSTLMDIVQLKCDATLIPTPGQAEQEYLATISK